MKIEKNSWLCGFFEGQSSFSILISLIESKNSRCVVFKPRITIGNVDDNQMEIIFKALKIEHTKPKNRKIGKVRTNVIVIQNFNDIKKVVELIENYRFASLKKQQSFDAFCVAYKKIEQMGYIKKKWDKEFKTIIDLKLTINDKRGNIDKKRLSQKDWEQKIREHLDNI